jgi:hypothetical protein
MFQGSAATAAFGTGMQFGTRYTVFGPALAAAQREAAGRAALVRRQGFVAATASGGRTGFVFGDSVFRSAMGAYVYSIGGHKRFLILKFDGHYIIITQTLL